MPHPLGLPPLRPGAAALGPSLLLALLAPALFGPAYARAQGSCTYRETQDGELISEVIYRLDREGRVTSEEIALEPSAIAARTVYTYDASGEVVGERVRVFEGPDPSVYGWGAPIEVRHQREGRVVRVLRSGHNGAFSERVQFVFDERGLPVEVHHGPPPGGREGEGSGYVCAYDLEGRPVYTAPISPSGPSREERFVWEEGRLARIERTWRDGQASYVIHRRGSRIWVDDGEGSQESWTGRCDQLLFGICSPALAPLPPSGRRARLPASTSSARPARPARRGRGAAATSPTAAASPIAFPRELSAGRLTLERIRAAYPGRRVTTSVRFGESSPDTPIPVVCVASPSAPCATVLDHDVEGRLLGIRTDDPSLAGPSGLRAGAPYAQVRGALTRCVIERGLEEGIRCQAREDPAVGVWLDITDEALRGDAEAPTEAILAGRRVLRMERAPAPSDAAAAPAVTPGSSPAGGSRPRGGSPR